MNNSIMQALKLGHKVFVDNSPAILIGVGVAGVVTTAVLAAVGTVKAQERIEEHKDKIMDSETQTEYVMTTIAAAAPAYLPAFGMAMATIAVIIASHKIQARRAAVIAGMYSLTESAFKEYRGQVKQLIGEKKEQGIRDEIVTKKLSENPHDDSKILVLSGDTMCYDDISGRYFKADISKIRRAISDANYQLHREDWISLNDMYNYIGLPEIAIGDDLGWHRDRGPIEEDFSSHLREGSMPVFVVKFTTQPKYFR